VKAGKTDARRSSGYSDMPMRIAFRKDTPPNPAARSFMAQLAG
jgi:hypothetical protein